MNVFYLKLFYLTDLKINFVISVKRAHFIDAVGVRAEVIAAVDKGDILGNGLEV